MKRKLLIISCMLGFLANMQSTSSAQIPRAKNDMKSMFIKTTNSLIDNFWGASFEGNEKDYYFYTLSNQSDKKNEWWWQAHAMDVIIDAYQLTGDAQYLDMYEQWYDGIRRFNYEHFDDDELHNHSIDDMEWIAITLIRMYLTCGDERYLMHAQRLYDNFILPTWGPEDEEPWHGGISWSSHPHIGKTKNACSNGPGGIIAAHLARQHEVLARHGVTKRREDYIHDVKMIYDWEHATLYDESTGAVHDSMGPRGVRKGVLSYNTGTFIAMAVDMYSFTHEQHYLDDAIKSADYTMSYLVDRETGLMSNVSFSRKGGDRGLFHGIFFRYLVRLINCEAVPAAKREAYAAFLRTNAELAVKCLQPETNIFSKNWAKERVYSFDSAPLTPHVTGCTLLSAVLSVDR